MKYAVILLCLMASACGHKTKLIRPSDIPEYERKRQEKIEKYQPYDPDYQDSQQSE